MSKHYQKKESRRPVRRASAHKGNRETGASFSDILLFPARLCTAVYNWIDAVREIFTAKDMPKAKAVRLLGLFGIDFNRRMTPAAIANLAVPALSVLVLLGTLFYWNTASFGLSVYIDGAKVATVENEAVYEEANVLVNSMVTYEGAREANYTTTPSYAITLNESLSSVDSVVESLLSQYEGELVEAAGLYVDGTLAAVAGDESDVCRVLDAYLAGASTREDVQVGFVQNVKVEAGLYPAGRVISAQKLAALLSSGTLELNVREMVEETYETSVDYETEITYDDTEYEDYSCVTREGVAGTATATDRVLLVDGEETGRERLSTVVTTQPVSRQVVKGTMKRPDGSVPGQASGSFCWPTPTLYEITTYYESRWGSFHAALDISGSPAYGAPIVASDAGYVSWAGDRDDGYGYYVIIDHGNGYETLYGHCSELWVSTGDLVAKGETIALVGSTGNSTGPHLHFEVRYCGVKVNPLNYIAY